MRYANHWVILHFLGTAFQFFFDRHFLIISLLFQLPNKTHQFDFRLGQVEIHDVKIQIFPKLAIKKTNSGDSISPLFVSF